MPSRSVKPRPLRYIWTSTSSGVTVPAGARRAFARVYGGGGSGAGGAGGDGSTKGGSGGSGGNAGAIQEGWFPVTPGETITAQIGAGGAAPGIASLGANGTAGNPGGLSYFYTPTAGYLFAAGGNGGTPGLVAGVNDTGPSYMNPSQYGGGGAYGGVGRRYGSSAFGGPGTGGSGDYSRFTSGGAGGSDPGANSLNGGPGGGGGAGRLPGGVGGGGGAEGIYDGQPGANAPANSGAGGGGSGGGPRSYGSQAPGAGGSGFVEVWFEVENQ